MPFSSEMNSHFHIIIMVFAGSNQTMITSSKTAPQESICWCSASMHMRISVVQVILATMSEKSRCSPLGCQRPMYIDPRWLNVDQNIDRRWINTRKTKPRYTIYLGLFILVLTISILWEARLHKFSHCYNTWTCLPVIEGKHSWPGAYCMISESHKLFDENGRH